MNNCLLENCACWNIKKSCCGERPWIEHDPMVDDYYNGHYEGAYCSRDIDLEDLAQPILSDDCDKEKCKKWDSTYKVCTDRLWCSDNNDTKCKKEEK